MRITMTSTHDFQPANVAFSMARFSKCSGILQYTVKPSTVQVTRLPSPRCFAFAAHFCKLLIFSSPEGYQLQFSIPRAYFVYMLRHCTGQHCSSMYACTYRFIRVLVCGTPWWVLLQHSNYVAIIFHRRVWNRALSLCCACIQIRASSSSPRLPLCQIWFLSWPPLLS